MEFYDDEDKQVIFHKKSSSCFKNAAIVILLTLVGLLTTNLYAIWFSREKKMLVREQQGMDSSGNWPNLQQFINGSSKVDLAPFDALLKNLPETSEGNSGPFNEERQIYIAAARLPYVKHICEIGFNGGHSASLWLLANPTAKVTMFDLWEHPYANTGLAFLRSTEAKQLGLRDVDTRLTIVKGSSIETVPQYARENPGDKCDVISVDGGHNLDVAGADLKNMKSLGTPRTVLFLDDTDCAPEWCIGPTKARDEAAQRRELQILHTMLVYVPSIKRKKGLSMMRYLYD